MQKDGVWTHSDMTKCVTLNKLVNFSDSFFIFKMEIRLLKVVGWLKGSHIISLVHNSHSINTLIISLRAMAVGGKKPKLTNLSKVYF